MALATKCPYRQMHFLNLLFQSKLHRKCFKGERKSGLSINDIILCTYFLSISHIHNALSPCIGYLACLLLYRTHSLPNCLMMFVSEIPVPWFLVQAFCKVCVDGAVISLIVVSIIFNLLSAHCPVYCCQFRMILYISVLAACHQAVSRTKLAEMMLAFHQPDLRSQFKLHNLQVCVSELFIV